MESRVKKSSGPRAYTKRPERWLFLVADAYPHASPLEGEDTTEA